jgi:hypothetical protein
LPKIFSVDKTAGDSAPSAGAMVDDKGKSRHESVNAAIVRDALAPINEFKRSAGFADLEPQFWPDLGGNVRWGEFLDISECLAPEAGVGFKLLRKKPTNN